VHACIYIYIYLYALCEIYIIISNIQDYTTVWSGNVPSPTTTDVPLVVYCVYVWLYACVYEVQVSVRILSVCVPIESVSEQGHFRSSSRCTMIYSRIYRHYIHVGLMKKWTKFIKYVDSVEYFEAINYRSRSEWIKSTSYIPIYIYIFFFTYWRDYFFAYSIHFFSSFFSYFSNLALVICI